MTGASETHAHDPLLGKRGAFEGVARRHGRRRNTARRPPRSSLRPPTNPLRHSPQRWVEKCRRSIKGSDTPQHTASLAAQQRDDAALMVSELVANAVMHGVGAIWLRIDVERDAVLEGRENGRMDNLSWSPIESRLLFERTQMIWWC